MEEQRNGITRSWNNVHVAWKVAIVIFFAGVSYAGYEDLKSQVSELKNSRAEIIKLQTQTEVLSVRVSSLQWQVNDMNDKLDLLIGGIPKQKSRNQQRTEQ